jgi:hypothetical protein
LNLIFFNELNFRNLIFGRALIRSLINLLLITLIKKIRSSTNQSTYIIRLNQLLEFLNKFSLLVLILANLLLNEIHLAFNVLFNCFYTLISLLNFTELNRVLYIINKFWKILSQRQKLGLVLGEWIRCWSLKFFSQIIYFPAKLIFNHLEIFRRFALQCLKYIINFVFTDSRV